MEAVLGSFGVFLPFWAILGPFLGPFWAILAGRPLEDPRFPWRRTGLIPGWCGNGLPMVPKSIGVGLERFGAEWRRFWGGFFAAFMAIFGQNFRQMPMVKGRKRSPG